jgi:predicted O-methyltransferase YrrM
MWKRLTIDVSEKAHKDLDELVKKYGIKKKILLSRIIEVFKERDEELIQLLFENKKKKEMKEEKVEVVKKEKEEVKKEEEKPKPFELKL